MNEKPFNTGDPLAYFITWTTYGTWLPGDGRGWSQKSNPGSLPANDLFVEVAQSRMKEPEFILAAEHRLIVENTIRKHCEIRRWKLHAVNPRTNHVHVVVTAPNYEPEVVRDQFKAWCTRKLKEAGLNRTDFWTERGSCRWINHESDLEAAIAYVMDALDRKWRDHI